MESFAPVFGIDLFSGQAQFAQSCRASGLRCEAFDNAEGPQGDILRNIGRKRLVLTALQLRNYSLVLAGPPCKSFVWPSSHHHKRTGRA